MLRTVHRNILHSYHATRNEIIINVLPKWVTTMQKVKRSFCAILERGVSGRSMIVRSNTVRGNALQNVRSLVRSYAATQRWFVGSLVRWFVRWFVGSFGRGNATLVRWFVGSLVRWFVRTRQRNVGSLVGWLVRSFVRWFVRTRQRNATQRWFVGSLIGVPFHASAPSTNVARS